MRLVINLPQISQMPQHEQESWRVRDNFRDQNHMELGLIQPEVPEPDPDADEEQGRITEVEQRRHWIDSHRKVVILCCPSKEFRNDLAIDA